MLHAGAIVIRGVPGDLRVTHADGRAYGLAPPGAVLTHVGEGALVPARPAAPDSALASNRFEHDP